MLNDVDKEYCEDLKCTLKALKFPEAAKENLPKSTDDEVNKIIVESYILNIFKDIISVIEEKIKIKLYKLIVGYIFDKELFDSFEKVEIDKNNKVEDYESGCITYKAKCKFTEMVSYIFKKMGYRNFISFNYVELSSPSIYYYVITIRLDWSDNEKPFWDITDDE